MLGTHAEVGVDAGIGEAGPQASQALRPSRPVGLAPGRALASEGAAAKSAGSGQPTAHM